MPIYEYVCQKCKHHLEVMQKMSDKPLVRCPQCRGKLEKVISQTSFQLKGSGWYVTDYSGRAKADKPEKADKADKADSKPESKTDKQEAKTEKKETKEIPTGGASTVASTPTSKSDPASN